MMIIIRTGQYNCKVNNPRIMYVNFMLMFCPVVVVKTFSSIDCRRRTGRKLSGVGSQGSDVYVVAGWQSEHNSHNVVVFEGFVN